MKPMAIAASAVLAVLATVARIAVAQTTGSPPPVTDPGVRATVEARALVATIQHNAEVIFDSLEVARTRQRTTTIRCVDESLSRADVALRRAREDASVLDAALAAHDAPAMGDILERLRVRASASHEAVVAAASCSPRDGAHSVDRTLVTVIVPRHVARQDR